MYIVRVLSKLVALLTGIISSGSRCCSCCCCCCSCCPKNKHFCCWVEQYLEEKNNQQIKKVEWYNIFLLSKVFSRFLLIFFFSIVWTFVDDQDRLFQFRSATTLKSTFVVVAGVFFVLRSCCLEFYGKSKKL